MKIICHEQEQKKAEIISEELIFQGADEAVMLVGELYYQGYDVIIWHQNNLPTSFFDLASGMAGEILQKFSNFRIKLAIVGDFSNLPSKSLTAFIQESNKGRLVHFSTNLAEALSF